jgi:hypothetical protein
MFVTVVPVFVPRPMYVLLGSNTALVSGQRGHGIRCAMVFKVRSVLVGRAARPADHQDAVALRLPNAPHRPTHPVHLCRRRHRAQLSVIACVPGTGGNCSAAGLPTVNNPKSTTGTTIRPACFHGLLLIVNVVFRGGQTRAWVSP